MQLRRFQSKDVSSALKMVKEELGEDAVILDTKKKNRLDPFTGKKVCYVEVVAAIDKKMDGDGVVDSGDAIETVSSGRQNSLQSYEPGIVSSIMEEIRSLREEIRRLSIYDNRKVRSDKENVHDVLSCLGLDRLTETKLLSRLYPKGTGNGKGLASRLREYISSMIRLGPTAEKCKGRCWWAVIGPTGVGKTTTLAKIAARLKFLCGKDGILVTVDSYRLGAVEQLQRFASLMEISLEVAKTNKELLRIFSANKHKDFILVDTTGRNPYISSHKTELERLFDAVPGLMAQVMLSATCKKEDLMETIGFYRRFPVAGWTLTKVDETKFLAPSILPIVEAQLPISYLTNGQRVPEDIMVPTASKIAEMVVGPIPDVENEMGDHVESMIKSVSLV